MNKRNMKRLSSVLSSLIVIGMSSSVPSMGMFNDSLMNVNSLNATNNQEKVFGWDVEDYETGKVVKVKLCENFLEDRSLGEMLKNSVGLKTNGIGTRCVDKMAYIKGYFADGPLTEEEVKEATKGKKVDMNFVIKSTSEAYKAGEDDRKKGDGKLRIKLTNDDREFIGNFFARIAVKKFGINCETKQAKSLIEGVKGFFKSRDQLGKNGREFLSSLAKLSPNLDKTLNNYGKKESLVKENAIKVLDTVDGAIAGTFKGAVKSGASAAQNWPWLTGVSLGIPFFLLYKL